MIEPSTEQWAMLAQALGDLVVAAGGIGDQPMTGPELLAHAEMLTEELKAGRLAVVRV